MNRERVDALLASLERKWPDKHGVDNHGRGPKTGRHDANGRVAKQPASSTAKAPDEATLKRRREMVEADEATVKAMKEHFNLEPEDIGAIVDLGMKDVHVGKVKVSFKDEPYPSLSFHCKASSDPGGGKEVFELQRSMSVSPKTGKTVHHNSFFIAPEYQGKGIAQHVYAEGEKAYAKAGMERIKTYANGTVGRYAWAQHGFDFLDTDTRNEVVGNAKDRLGWAKLDDYAKGLDGVTHAWELASFEAFDGKKFSVRDLSESRAEILKDKGVDVDTKVNLGKALMLAGKDWDGVKSLKPGSESLKVADKYRNKKPAITESKAKASTGKPEGCGPDGDDFGFHVNELGFINGLESKAEAFAAEKHPRLPNGQFAPKPGGPAPAKKPRGGQGKYPSTAPKAGHYWKPDGKGGFKEQPLGPKVAGLTQPSGQPKDGHFWKPYVGHDGKAIWLHSKVPGATTEATSKKPEAVSKPQGDTGGSGSANAGFKHDAVNPVNLNEAKVLGGQMGSNPGGKVEIGGQAYYMKATGNDLAAAHRAASEKLAADLYKLAGVDGPDVSLVALNGKLNGKDVSGEIGVASKWQDGLQMDANALKPGGKVHEAAVADFATHAWLANWDAVGTGYDNLKVGPDGKPKLVDAGGSLEYRAQGGKKTFGEEVLELQSMRDPSKNAYAAAVYGKMTDEQLLGSIKKVTAMSDDKIRAVVMSNPGLTAPQKLDLSATLIMRKGHLRGIELELEDKIKAKAVKPSVQAVAEQVVAQAMGKPAPAVVKTNTGFEDAPSAPKVKGNGQPANQPKDGHYWKPDGSGGWKEAPLGPSVASLKPPTAEAAPGHYWKPYSGKNGATWLHSKLPEGQTAVPKTVTAKQPHPPKLPPKPASASAPAIAPDLSHFGTQKMTSDKFGAGFTPTGAYKKGFGHHKSYFAGQPVHTTKWEDDAVFRQTEPKPVAGHTWVKVKNPDNPDQRRWELHKDKYSNAPATAKPLPAHIAAASAGKEYKPVVIGDGNPPLMSTAVKATSPKPVGQFDKAKAPMQVPGHTWHYVENPNGTAQWQLHPDKYAPTSTNNNMVESHHGPVKPTNQAGYAWVPLKTYSGQLAWGKYKIDPNAEPSISNSPSSGTTATTNQSSGTPKYVAPGSAAPVAVIDKHTLVAKANAHFNHAAGYSTIQKAHLEAAKADPKIQSFVDSQMDKFTTDMANSKTSKAAEVLASWRTYLKTGKPPEWAHVKEHNTKLAKAAGIEADKYELHRGVSDDEMAGVSWSKEIAQAWYSGASEVVFTHHEVSSWSPNKNTAYGFSSSYGGVVVKAHVPAKDVIADIISQPYAMKKHATEREFVVATEKPNSIRAKVEDCEVGYNGKFYTYAQRQLLFEAMGLTAGAKYAGFTLETKADGTEVGVYRVNPDAGPFWAFSAVKPALTAWEADAEDETF